MNKMFNILLVNTRHRPGGGDSTYTFNLADLLRAQGHKVHHFAMKDRSNLPDANSDLFVSHIDFRDLNRNKNLANGLKVIFRSIYSLEARRNFSELIDRVKPDIVHVQSLHGHITPSILPVAKKRNIPVLWTLHDFKLICPNTSFRIDKTAEHCEACKGGAFYQATLKRCKKDSLLASGMASIEAYVHQVSNVRDQVDMFIAPSAFLRSKFIEFGFPEDKIIHISNFFPDNLLLTDQGSSDPTGYVLYFGRVTRLKGIETLLRAAESIPEIPIKIAGGLDPQMEATFRHLPPNVAYVGEVFGDMLVKLIRQARFVVLPALWHENQPMSILEAFALGKPVIASQLGGLTELIGNNLRGFLVSPGDPIALVKAIESLWENPDKSEILGEKARAYLKEEHSQDVHYQQLSSIYKRLKQA